MVMGTITANTIKDDIFCFFCMKFLFSCVRKNKDLKRRVFHFVIHTKELFFNVYIPHALNKIVIRLWWKGIFFSLPKISWNKFVFELALFVPHSLITKNFHHQIPFTWRSYFKAGSTCFVANLGQLWHASRYITSNRCILCWLDNNLYDLSN